MRRLIIAAIIIELLLVTACGRSITAPECNASNARDTVYYETATVYWCPGR